MEKMLPPTSGLWITFPKKGKLLKKEKSGKFLKIKPSLH